MSWITKFGSEFPMNAVARKTCFTDLKCRSIWNKTPRKITARLREVDLIQKKWYIHLRYILHSEFSTFPQGEVRSSFKKIHNSKNRNCNMYHHLPPCAVTKLCFLLRPQLGHIHLQLHVVVGPKMKQQSNLPYNYPCFLEVQKPVW